MPEINPHIAGCFYGGALGDAIGAVYENSKLKWNAELPVTMYFTDDTQFTIATCQAITNSNKIDPEIIANHFRHLNSQRFFTGLGSSTLKSLTELQQGGHWALVGATGERAAGNGAAMRIAPLNFVLVATDHQQRRMIKDICWITHRNDEAYLGALAILLTMHYVRTNKQIDHLVLEFIIDQLPDCKVRDRLQEIKDDIPTLLQYRDRYHTSGYVVDSIPFAILASIQATSFNETLKQIIECGGDTDTNAALFGQLFGLTYGVNALPLDLLPRITQFDLLQDTIRNFTKCKLVN